MSSPRVQPGHALTSSTTSPARMKNSTSSAWALTVTAVSTAKMLQSSGSRLLVPRASFYAAMAMMAMTVAPIA